MSYLSVSERSVTNGEWRRGGSDEERIGDRGGEDEWRSGEAHVRALRPEVTTDTAANKQWRRFTSQLKCCSERVLFVRVRCSH